MNMSELITWIKMDIGIYNIALPFENADQALVDVIKLKTRKIFSIFSPDFQMVYFNTSDLEIIAKGTDYVTYLLPNAFADKTIITIRDVQYDNTVCNNLSQWGGVPMGTNLVHAAILGNANVNMINKVIPKLTFNYRHPRELTLYNAVSSPRIKCDIGFKHDESLISIKPTTEDSFIELATLDIKMFLYNTLKHYTDLPNAFGSVQLKIDEWQNAESDRKQLIADWEERYHIDILEFMWA